MNSDQPTPEKHSLTIGGAARPPILPSNRRTAGVTHRAGAAPGSENGLTPAFLWRVFCQNWKWALPLGFCLAALTGTAVWYFHVPNYEAIVLIRIESEPPFIAFDEGRVSRDADRFVQTQIEVLRSSVVLSPVLRREEVASIPEIKRADDRIKYLQSQLSVKQVGKSELYQVSYLNPSPRNAVAVAKAIVAEYLVWQIDQDKNRFNIVVNELEKEKENRADKVRELRKDVVDLAKELTGKDPFVQGAALDISAFSPAASIYQSLTEAEVGLEVLKAELQALQAAPKVAADKLTATGFVELELSNRADVRQLEQRIAGLSNEIAVVKSRPRTKIGDSWEQDPEYLRLQEQQSLAKSELVELRELAREELVNLRLNERRAEHERLIALKRQEIAATDTKRAMLQTRFEQKLNEFKSDSEQSARLEFKKAELAREEKVFDLIAARKLALQTEQRAPARVSYLDEEARIPTAPLNPVPYKPLLLGCFLSLVAPLALSVGRESIARRINDPEQLGKETLLPVLGEIARFPVQRVSATRQALPSPQQREMFVFAESIDSLRTNLMLTENLGAPGQKKVVAICSAGSGEGKTSVATSLAMSLAEATKQPILLVDADLRAPDVASCLDVPSHPGLAELLCNKASLAQAIHRIGETNTYVMPAGKLRGNPHHILHGSRIPNLLAALRKEFSTIVIDTPPVLSASESLVYAKAADLVVFCSLAEVSRAKPARAAVERLQGTGANVAGAILSGVPVNRYVYQYGTYVSSE